MAGKLASKPWDEAALAEKIRRLRKASGLTQAALADRMGISEPAVRNYELMRALPSEKHIESMAKAFGVRPECLHLYDFRAPSVLANSLFQIAETYGLTPTRAGGSACLLPTSSFMSRFLDEWARRYSNLGKGRVSRENYERWKDAYTAEYDPKEFATRYEDAPEEGSCILIPSWGAYCFSRKIRRIRESQGSTQAAFSARLGIKEGVYRSYEQGWRLPRRSVLKGIAATSRSPRERSPSSISAPPSKPRMRCSKSRTPMR